MDKSDAEATTGEMPGVSQETLWHAHRMVSVGRLLGGVAHEFNNLMQGIVASLELTRKLVLRGRAAQAEPFIAKAITSAQQASLFNQRVARFAHPRPIAPEALSINAVIADIEGLLVYSLSSTFKLEITPAADLGTVYCDAGQAEIAIVDMVLEARDSMPNGGAITIATRNDEHSDDTPASHAAHGARHRVCVTVTAEESRDQGSTVLSPADANQPPLFALDTVDRFARMYGGEMRLGDATRQITAELCLPRFATL